MSKVKGISDLISKSTINHSNFLNGYLSFLVQFLKHMNISIHDPDLKDIAERSIALALNDLKNYQSGYKTIKSLYSYYIIHFSLTAFSNTQLVNELHYLIGYTYRSEYWKKVALEALDPAQPKVPKIYYDPSTMRRSTPWLSADVLIKREDNQNESIH